MQKIMRKEAFKWLFSIFQNFFRTSISRHFLKLPVFFNWNWRLPSELSSWRLSVRNTLKLNRSPMIQSSDKLCSSTENMTVRFWFWRSPLRSRNGCQKRRLNRPFFLYFFHKKTAYLKASSLKSQILRRIREILADEVKSAVIFGLRAAMSAIMAKCGRKIIGDSYPKSDGRDFHGLLTFEAKAILFL